MPRHSFFAATGALLAFAPLFAPSPAAAQHTYLAVGDSVAFGYMNPTLTPDPPPTAGYAGYTVSYANYLSGRSTASGTGPVSLINLGIVGETTTSLLTPTNNNGLLNSNYNPLAPMSQYTLLTSDLNSSVSNVTVQIGANDILGLATTTAFETAVATGDTATQQALLAGTLNTVAANTNTLLGQIHTLAPQANVQVLGYYNPYAALTGLDPISMYLKSVSAPLNIALNNTLAGEAAAHGDQFVDLYTPFLGHETTLTLSNEFLTTPFGLVPNDHPTAAGYGVITQQLEAPVPEASTVVSLSLLLALGLGGIAAAARKKKAAAKA